MSAEDYGYEYDYEPEDNMKALCGIVKYEQEEAAKQEQR